MALPGDIFGVIPVWVGVYLALLLTQALAGWLAYRRVIHLIRQGRSVARFDRPWARLRGAVSIVLGQRKVLQRVGSQDARSRALDLAGLGHALVFWGFLSFALSYLIFIFGAALWPPLPETLLTPTGVRIYSVYLDLYAALILAVLAWMLARRWAARPYRLSFDLTRSLDAVIVIGLTAALNDCHPAGSCLLCGGRRSRPGGRRAGRRSYRPGFDRYGFVRRGRRDLPRRLLVAAFGHHPGLWHLCSHFQAHPYDWRPAERLLPFPGTPGGHGGD